MDQSQYCTSEVYYMIGVVVVAAGGYFAIRDIRRRRRENGRDGNERRDGQSGGRYGALSTTCSTDMDDVSTNTTPRTTMSTATQYTADDEMFDCVVTSPFGSDTQLDADSSTASSTHTTSASLVSRGSASPRPSSGWLSLLWR